MTKDGGFALFSWILAVVDVIGELVHQIDRDPSDFGGEGGIGGVKAEACDALACLVCRDEAPVDVGSIVQLEGDGAPTLSGEVATLTARYQRATGVSARSPAI